MSQRTEAFSTGTCVTCHKSSGESGNSVESAWIWAKDHLKSFPRHRIAILLEAHIVQLNEGEKSAWSNTVERFKLAIKGLD